MGDGIEWTGLKAGVKADKLLMDPDIVLLVTTFYVIVRVVCRTN